MAAKTYRDISPDSNVILVDSASSVGGVWATDRLYTGIKTNNFVGSYEYSDFPLDHARFNVSPGQHIPGKTVQQYLEAYVDQNGLRNSIWLNSRVATAAHCESDSSWVLTIVQTGTDTTVSLKAQKLIVATGLTSEPSIPEFPGKEEFQTPLFHSQALAQHEDSILRSQGGYPVTILGSGKSALDAVYTSAASGRPVHWIIRESGHGPGWITTLYATPLNIMLERLPGVRLLTWFSPCVWGDMDGFGMVRRLLHGTRLGRKVVRAFWSLVKSDLLRKTQYDSHPEMQKLTPWIDPFWVGNSFSGLNYPTDVFEYFRNGRVQVHIADISHLSPHTVHLSTGLSIQTTALICATGWKPTPAIKFLPEGIDRDLGLPTSADILSQEMVRAAEQEILRQFPSLSEQPSTLLPKYKPQAGTCHAYRLTRFMVPPTMLPKRSIVFVGTVLSFHASIIAQTQALWASAYLTGNLTVPPTTQSPPHVNTGQDNPHLWETALHTEFGKLRYPGGFGHQYADFVYDVLPYVDLLLKDMRLRSHRKANVLAEIFMPYTVKDYQGLVEEWKGSHSLVTSLKVHSTVKSLKSSVKLV